MSYPGNIVIRVIRARNLPKKDSTGSIDPYFNFKVGKSAGKTSTKKNDRNPEYGETISLSYNPNFNTKVILVECYDWDRFSSNDLVATALVPFEEFQNRRQQRSFPLNDKNLKAQGEIELEILYEAQGAPAFAPQGQYPPQNQYDRGGYPPQQQYPPQGGGYMQYPPQQYPPQGGGYMQYPPQGGGYGQYPPQQQYPPQTTIPPQGRPMKLKLKQKAVTLGADKFSVKDESGKDVLFVRGEFLAIGKALHITDAQGQELAYIDEQNTSMRYDITIKQPSQYSFTLIEKNGSMEILGLNWKASGKKKEKEFHVHNEFNMEVMHLSKESFTVGDGYDLYVTNSADMLPSVCIALIIDATFFD